MQYDKNFDVIVIGAGHAGVEASMASSRMGCKTLLLTHNMDDLGQMSCNPSIGGIGKSHLVKEIDAMGGIMAKAIDYSGIHFKILNSKKGLAVRSTRAQADRILYKQIIKLFLENQPNLLIFQQKVDDLIIKKNTAIGVITSTKLKFYARAIVLSVGTFLNSKIYVGIDNCVSNKINGSLDDILSSSLRNLPLRVDRLKTGTPPRIDKRSINFNNLLVQHGDDPTPVFSFLGKKDNHPNQVPCYITYTNKKTHEIIRDNLLKSPTYIGKIKSSGPRYCPSIEDKIIRFPNRDSHRIFLEPEGLSSNEIYPNGISTSLPFSVQIKIIRSIKGLENSYITRVGYAIEYDFFDPRDLNLTLESKLISRLFFAGQINGTTGYEEAAAQGLVAGLNAAQLSLEKDYWVPRRNDSYLGVMIDDLCTLGTNEPYRMFTSRSEYRLILREDNADLRLTEIGYNLNLVDNLRWIRFCNKIENIEKERQRLRNVWICPSSKNKNILKEKFNISLDNRINIENLLRRPEITYKFLSKNLGFISSITNDEEAISEVETQIKYQGYILRQKKDVLRNINYEYILLPKNFDYKSIPGLSKEIISKLNSCKPNSLGQVSRIPGITPAAISILLIWLKKHIN